MSLGLPEREALKKTYHEWQKIQSVCEVKLVEKDTKTVFDRIKKKYGVIALTTRGFQISYSTIYSLESLGLFFDDIPYISQQFFYQNVECEGIFTGVLFYKGVLFTNSSNKGEALFTLLDKANKKPKSILFINDKLSHLVQVQNSADRRKIPFIGLRYGYTDEKVKNINPNLTKLSSIDFARLIDRKVAEACTKK